MDKKMKKVNKLWYCVIILLFGSIGVHHFYAGHTVKGILYLCFFWTGIPELLTIIDLICAIMEESDADGNIYI